MRDGDVIPCPRCGKPFKVYGSGDSWGGECSSAYCGQGMHNWGKESLRTCFIRMYNERKARVPMEVEGDQISLFGE